MAELNIEWLTRSPVDFEYNKYRLLAYIGEVEKRYRRTEIYPVLEDVKRDLDQLRHIRNSSDEIRHALDRRYGNVSIQDLNLIRKTDHQSSPEWQHISDSLGFAIPKLQRAFDNGIDIQEFIMEQADIDPVGITPLYQDEGYVIFEIGDSRERHIFRYKAVPVEQDRLGQLNVRLTFMERIRKRLGESLNVIKTGLARRFKELPNPAVFLFHSPLEAPMEPTILPVASRLMSRVLYR